MKKEIKIDPNSNEFRAIATIAVETEVFVAYIQSCDSALTKHEATVIAATVIGSLPEMFKHDPTFYQRLKAVIALGKEFKDKKKLGVCFEYERSSY